MSLLPWVKASVLAEPATKLRTSQWSPNPPWKLPCVPVPFSRFQKSQVAGLSVGGLVTGLSIYVQFGQLLSFAVWPSSWNTVVGAICAIAAAAQSTIQLTKNNLTVLQL